MHQNAQDQVLGYNGSLQSVGLPADPAHEVYREALSALSKAQIPFLVGGAF